MADSKFAGKTYTRIFLYSRILIMFVTKFFSLSVDPSLILHFSLLGNLCLWAIVWIRPCSTDKREVLLYRDLMVLPVFSNILGYSAISSPNNPGLTAAWLCVTFLLVLPLTGVHFYLNHRKAKAGEEPKQPYSILHLILAPCLGAANEESPSADLVINAAKRDSEL